MKHSKQFAKILSSFLVTVLLLSSAVPVFAAAAPAPQPEMAFAKGAGYDVFFSDTRDPADPADENKNPPDDPASSSDENTPSSDDLAESSDKNENPDDADSTSDSEPDDSQPKGDDDTLDGDDDRAGDDTEDEIGTRDLRAGTGVRGFVERLYELVMGRASDVVGIEYWTNEITGGKKTAAETVYFFFNSPEFAEITGKNPSNDTYLSTLYHSMMDRDPDAGGMAFWQERLNGGLSRNYVLHGFLVLSEFTGICERYGVNRGDFALSESRDKSPELTFFLTRLYQNCMGRPADVDGLNFWAGRLLAGQATGASVVAYFFTSAEFNKKNLNNEDFLTTAYRTLFGRAADVDGYNYWLGIFKSGVSRTYILNQFVVLTEFTNACQKAGIERSSIPLTEARDKNIDITSVAMNTYRALFNQDADTAGLNALCNQFINNKQNAVETLYNFTVLPEFIGRDLGTRDYIAAIFGALCGRSPSEDELTIWANRLAPDDAINRREIFLLIANSQPCHAYLGAKLGLSTFGNFERGLDVSAHQKSINWNQVVADGYQFVMIRAVTTPSGAKAPAVDAYFYQNVRRAKAAGLKVGVYIYSYARTDEYIVEEVNLGLAAIREMEKEGYRFDYPIAMDMEEFARHPSNGKPEWTSLALHSLAIIDQQGYYPCLYSYANGFKNQFYMDQLKGYDLWVAHFTENINVPMAYPGAIWQYTSSGRVAGIGGLCDLNVSYKDFATEIRKLGKNNFK